MSTTVKEVEILSTLEEEPHVHFFPWEADVQDIAAGMAKSLHPLGLLSAVLTDEQWAAYPGNATIDQNGQIQLAARFAPPVYVDIHNGMNNVDLYVAKALNERLQLWIDATEALKRALLKSLGRVVRQIIKPKTVRFQTMSIADIMQQVRKRYGKMEKDTRANLQDRMLTLLPTVEGIDTHMSNLLDMFEVSETAGFPIDMYRQVEIFRETVCAHPLVVKVLETFDFDFPDSKAVTYEQITAYLVLHLPNVKHAQLAATRATANFVAATAYTVLEAESKRLRAEVEQLKRKRTDGKGKGGKNGKQNGGKRKGDQQNGGKQKDQQKTQKQKDGNQRDQQARTSDEPTVNMKYCHGHGYQHSHISSECKLLAGDKQKFNAAMRRATGPNQPPGGSTKVNGQQPKTVTANMASSVTGGHESDDEDDWDQQNDQQHDDDTSFDETAVFLANVLYGEDKSYSTTEATALMMEGDTLLLDDMTESKTSLPIIQTDVARPSLDVNPGGQTNVGTVIGQAGLIPVQASSSELTLYPTQAAQAAISEIARSCDSRQSSSQESGEDLRGGKVEDRAETAPPTPVIITDGSQFRLPFWEAELNSLQNLLRRQILRQPSRRPKTIPTADELQLQFVKWLLKRPELPLLVTPASSGFYEAVYGCSMQPPPRPCCR